MQNVCQRERETGVEREKLRGTQMAAVVTARPG